MSLKEKIDKKHREAEQTEFNQRLVKGQLHPVEYKTYLFQQLMIFAALETCILPHPSLNRYWKILDDFLELNTDEQIANKRVKLMPSTDTYRNYLLKLSREEMLPHVYLNYLAHMFGGQIIKRNVPGSGKMYDFENKEAALQSIRNLQTDDWVDEVNKGLDFHIKIYNELQENFRLYCI